MAVREIKQKCPVCKGTGIGKEQLKDAQGRTVLAPPYRKGEGDKPQYVNCTECNGEGLTLQPLPQEVLVDGHKLKLDKRDAFMRVNQDVVLPEGVFEEAAK